MGLWRGWGAVRLTMNMGRAGGRRAAALAMLCAGAAGLMPARAQDHLIVQPNPRPFSAPAQDDPLLALARTTTTESRFRAEVESAVRYNPLLEEARAGVREAEAARVQARSALFPTVDLTVDANRSFARNFSNDPGNIIERSRPEGRTDATASIRQRLLDFGATSSRINAGNARVTAAENATLGYGQDVAVRTVTAWYSILAQRLMAQAAEEYVTRQGWLRTAIEKRIANGFSARGELARVDSSIANVQTRLASFRRDLASSQAQYRALTGHDAPPDLARAPLPRAAADTPEALDALIARSPVVLRAEAEARAARQDARATRSERLPTISAGLDAGRYGVFENPGDYDIRGRVIVRAQLGAGINARADQATARADAADAYAARVRQEALRDAQMSLADVKGLEAQLAAAEASYIANRTGRDVVATRFEASQGTVTDLLYAEDSYFYSITTFIQTLAERDVSRFVLLAKSGLLLDDLGIRVDPAERMAQP